MQEDEIILVLGHLVLVPCQGFHASMNCLLARQ